MVQSFASLHGAWGVVVLMVFEVRVDPGHRIPDGTQGPPLCAEPWVGLTQKLRQEQEGMKAE